MKHLWTRRMPALLQFLRWQSTRHVLKKIFRHLLFFGKSATESLQCHQKSASSVVTAAASISVLKQADVLITIIRYKGNLVKRVYQVLRLQFPYLQWHFSWLLCCISIANVSSSIFSINYETSWWDHTSNMQKSVCVFWHFMLNSLAISTGWIHAATRDMSLPCRVKFGIIIFKRMRSFENQAQYVQQSPKLSMYFTSYTSLFWRRLFFKHHIRTSLHWWLQCLL